MKARLFATVPMGIEDVSSKEIEEILGCRAIPDIGRVFFEADLKEAVYCLNLEARTLHKVLVQLCRGNFEQLNDIYKLAENVDYTSFIGENQSFAVRSERVGVHNFTSIDVSRIVGQAIINSYQKSNRKKLQVNLENPDVEIYALVRENEFLLGINTTEKSLHKRGYRVYEHPAALKPTIAAAMLKISGWSPRKSLIDPMCGGATIPIEAAFIAHNIAPNRYRTDFAFLKHKMFKVEEFEEFRKRTLEKERINRFEIYGMEKFREHLEGGIKNAKKAGVHGAINFKIGDATIKTDYPSCTLEFIVTNPPYGVRMIPDEKTLHLYEKLLETLKNAAPGSTLVLITAATKRFQKAVEKTKTQIKEAKRVIHGQLKTTIFKCKI
jgi:tRNA (guanine6-N2)-methyltransferase